MTPPLSRLDVSWRRHETAALILLATLAGAALGVRAILCEPWPGCSPRQQILRLSRASETIDLNTASVGSLIRLPEIGPRRAQAIIEYRSRPATSPFRRLEDLERVPGIGEGIVREIARVEPFLAFSARPGKP
jgi:competence ComEA-like helix-hairpin-helix protein